MSSVAPVGANGRVRGGRVDTSAAAIVGYRDVRLAIGWGGYCVGDVAAN